MKLGITDVPGSGVEHSANSLRDGDLKPHRRRQGMNSQCCLNINNNINNPTATAVTAADQKDLNAESHQLMISKVFHLSAIIEQLSAETHVKITG